VKRADPELVARCRQRARDRSLSNWETDRYQRPPTSVDIKPAAYYRSKDEEKE